MARHADRHQNADTQHGGDEYQGQAAARFRLPSDSPPFNRQHGGHERGQQSAPHPELSPVGFGQQRAQRVPQRAHNGSLVHDGRLAHKLECGRDNERHRRHPRHAQNAPRQQAPELRDNLGMDAGNGQRGPCHQYEERHPAHYGQDVEQDYPACYRLRRRLQNRLIQAAWSCCRRDRLAHREHERAPHAMAVHSRYVLPRDCVRPVFKRLDGYRHQVRVVGIDRAVAAIDPTALGVENSNLAERGFQRLGEPYGNSFGRVRQNGVDGGVGLYEVRVSFGGLGRQHEENQQGRQRQPAGSLSPEQRYREHRSIRL